MSCWSHLSKFPIFFLACILIREHQKPNICLLQMMLFYYSDWLADQLVAKLEITYRVIFSWNQTQSKCNSKFFVRRHSGCVQQSFCNFCDLQRWPYRVQPGAARHNVEERFMNRWSWDGSHYWPITPVPLIPFRNLNLYWIMGQVL